MCLQATRLIGAAFRRLFPWQWFWHLCRVEFTRRAPEDKRLLAHLQSMTAFIRNHEDKHHDPSLRFSFPYRRYGYLIVTRVGLIMLMLMFTNLFAGYFVRIQRSLGTIDPTAIFFLGGALFFAAISLLWAFDLLWQFIGKEIVEINSTQIIIRHEFLGIGITKKVPAGKILSLFVPQEADNFLYQMLESRSIRFFHFGFGAIAFITRTRLFNWQKTYRFGSSLDKTQAAKIVAMIYKTIPDYRHKSS